jgi:hypothetical protein
VSTRPHKGLRPFWLFVSAIGGLGVLAACSGDPGSPAASRQAAAAAESRIVTAATTPPVAVSTGSLGHGTHAALASGGIVARSANYTMAVTLGQGPGTNDSSRSANYHIVGATQ